MEVFCSYTAFIAPLFLPPDILAGLREALDRSFQTPGKFERLGISFAGLAARLIYQCFAGLDKPLSVADNGREQRPRKKDAISLNP